MLVRLYAHRAELSPEAAALIAPERWSRIASYPPEERALSLAGELLLHRAVRDFCPDYPLPVRRQELPDGKPVLPDLPEFHFNLSHSGTWAICAVSSTAVGADLQRERPVRPALFRRLAPEEQASLEALSGPEQTRAFFDLWTVKEAYLKATGRGLLGGLDSFTVSRNKCGVALSAPGYTAAEVPFFERGYHLAVCIRGPGPVEIQWEKPE